MQGRTFVPSRFKEHGHIGGQRYRRLGRKSARHEVVGWDVFRADVSAPITSPQCERRGLLKGIAKIV